MPERQASGDTLLMRGFGERLRLLRIVYAERFGAQHHTKARWAERLWVSPAMFGRWEGGNHLPKFVDLMRISLLFRVDPNYLVEGVLSEHLERWLYQALKAGNPELLDAADYWQRQSVLFWQANQALADEESEADTCRAIARSHNRNEERSTVKSPTSSPVRINYKPRYARIIKPRKP